MRSASVPAANPALSKGNILAARVTPTANAPLAVSVELSASQAVAVRSMPCATAVLRLEHHSHRNPADWRGFTGTVLARTIRRCLTLSQSTETHPPTDPPKPEVSQPSVETLILLNPESGQYYTLDEVGSDLGPVRWESPGHGPHATIHAEFDAPVAAIQADVMELPHRQFAGLSWGVDPPFSGGGTRGGGV